MIMNEVEVRIGSTINLGNFESARLDYSVRAQLEEGDSAKASIDKLREHLREKMAKDIASGKHKLVGP